MIVGYSEDQKIVAIMALLLNKEDIRATAGMLGISHMTLYRWKREFGDQVQRKLIGMTPEEMQGYIDRFNEFRKGGDPLTLPEVEELKIEPKPETLPVKPDPEENDSSIKLSQNVSQEFLLDENRRSLYTAIMIRERGVRKMAKLMKECKDIRSLAYAVSVLNDTIKSGLPSPFLEEIDKGNYRPGNSETLIKITERMLENAKNQKNQKS